MSQTLFAIGDKLLKDKFHQVLGLNPITITYNTDGTVNTVTDGETGVVYTLSYDSQQKVSSIADADNTWTLSYDTQDRVENISVT